jgi:hypothetical protein
MTRTASFLRAVSRAFWPSQRPFPRQFTHRHAPLFLLAFGLQFGAGPATAQLATNQRTLPADIQLAKMVVVQPPLIHLNDSVMRLAPGARIYGPDQLLKLSASLVDQPFKVAFTLDSLGLVKQVWILTEAERKQFGAK